MIRQRGHAVCGVIVDVFHGKGEAGHLVHGIAVIIVLAVIRAQVKRPDRRRVLLDTSQLGHVGRRLLWLMFILY